jgi:membrane dipeptidase
LNNNFGENAGMKKIMIILYIFLFTSSYYAGDELYQKAKDLAQKFIIIDTHIDLPLHLVGEWKDVTQRLEKGEIDYPRAVEGGLNAPFMSIYISPRHQGKPSAKETADTLIAIVERLQTEHPDKFKMAYSVNDILKNFENGLISLPMGMENGTPVENFEILRYYYDKGIRYITLTHGKWNHICDSSYDEDKHWNGLSPFGKELVQEMNKIGIMIDVSHVSDSAFYQAIELTKAPVIASHSSCRFFTPGFERNMSDDMIKKLGEKGGVIQMNFGSEFLDEGFRERDRIYNNSVKQFIDEHHVDNNDPLVKEFKQKYRREHPLEYATVAKVVDHIDHVVGLIGIDHVGLGSDFDGLGDQLPAGLKDVSMYPNLIHELLKRGYSEVDIEKICSGNILRVWKEVEEYAALH